MTQSKYGTSKYWLILGDAVNRVYAAQDYAARNMDTDVARYMVLMVRCWQAVHMYEPHTVNQVTALGTLEQCFDAFNRHFNPKGDP